MAEKAVVPMVLFLVQQELVDTAQIQQQMEVMVEQIQQVQLLLEEEQMFAPPQVFLV
jgi:hypothetical protein